MPPGLGQWDCLGCVPLGLKPGRPSGMGVGQTWGMLRANFSQQVPRFVILIRPSGLIVAHLQVGVVGQEATQVVVVSLLVIGRRGFSSVVLKSKIFA